MRLKQPAKIGAALEQELIASIVCGAASPSILDPKELSKIGRIVHSAVTQLAKNGLSAPFKLSTIYAHCLANLGAPEADTKEFLRTIQEIYRSKDHKVLIRVSKQKAALVEILNEASKQLGNGLVDLKKFNEIAEKQKDAGEKLVPMSELKPGDPPMGAEIESLPTISAAARGVQGVWIIGGREGVGKSTLMLQIAIELAQQQPVIYYDVDGTGETWMRYRIEQAVGKENYIEASRHIYYRPFIDTLDSDLASLPNPSSIVVDSIQTLPYQINQRRSSVDSWLSTFKGLTNKGITVLITSELSWEGHYKESSGINYAGALNAVLEVDEANDDFLHFVVKKNRHGPKKGHIATLIRNATRPMWFEEA